MKHTVLLFCVLSLILVKYAKAYEKLQVDTMDTSKTTIRLFTPSFGYSSSGILKSHSGARYKVGINKTLFVKAPFGYSLMVSFRYIDLRPYNKDVLTLFSVGGVYAKNYSNSLSYRKKRSYPKEDETYYVPNGDLGIRFLTNNANDNFGYDGFELIYTVQGIGFQCNSDDFYCDSSRCIANILRCDGHNHCGDRSSERNCKYTDSYKDVGPGKMIGTIFGCVFLVIAVACGVYAICRRRHVVIESQTVISSHPPPPINVSSYPPAYPQQGTYYPPPPPPYSQGITNPTYH